MVGEGPGETEDREGRPFVGPAGKLLDWLLQAAGLAREDLWITNLMKYRLTDENGFNRPPRALEAIAARKYLAAELGVICPEMVLLCGKYAYQAAYPNSSVMADHGKVRESPGSHRDTVYIPMLHPAHILRNDDQRAIALEDFRRLRPAVMASAEGTQRRMTH